MSQEMDFNERLQRAFALLESKGIGKSTYSPPLFRLFWKLGIQVPPPHMAGFGFNTLLMGGFFGVFWGLCMWLLLWGRQGMPVVIAAAVALGTGLLFGLVMAWYMRYSARKRGIPSWHEFTR